MEIFSRTSGQLLFSDPPCESPPLSCRSCASVIAAGSHPVCPNVDPATPVFHFWEADESRGGSSVTSPGAEQRLCLILAKKVISINLITLQ